MWLELVLVAAFAIAFGWSEILRRRLRQLRARHAELTAKHARIRTALATVEARRRGVGSLNPPPSIEPLP